MDRRLIEGLVKPMYDRRVERLKSAPSGRIYSITTNERNSFLRIQRPVDNSRNYTYHLEIVIRQILYVSKLTTYDFIVFNHSTVNSGNLSPLSSYALQPAGPFVLSNKEQKDRKEESKNTAALSRPLEYRSPSRNDPSKRKKTTPSLGAEEAHRPTLRQDVSRLNATYYFNGPRVLLLPRGRTLMEDRACNSFDPLRARRKA